jgi:hypothetical protein
LKSYRMEFDGWFPPPLERIKNSLKKRQARSLAKGRCILASLAFGVPMCEGRKRSVGLRIEGATGWKEPAAEMFRSGIAAGLFEAGLIPDEDPQFFACELVPARKKPKTVVFLREESHE